LQKPILILLAALALTSCATTKPINQLPLGSTVALISALDNQINYRYVGVSVYLNSETTNTDATLDPDAAILPPIKNTLEKHGYRVITLHTNAKLQSAALNQASRQASRAIVLTKARNCDFSQRRDDAMGYGYIQKENNLKKITYIYGAVNVSVVELPSMKVVGRFKTCANNFAMNELFVTDAEPVNHASVSYLKRWFKTSLAPNVLYTLKEGDVVK
jgi:hypothetical protein